MVIQEYNIINKEDGLLDSVIKVIHNKNVLKTRGMLIITGEFIKKPSF